MIHPHNKWPGCVSYLESSQTNRLGIACRRSIEHNFTAVELLTKKSPKMPFVQVAKVFAFWSQLIKEASLVETEFHHLLGCAYKMLHFFTPTT